MECFELDLRYDATRASLVSQLREVLGEDAWAHIELMASQAGIKSDAHYHSAVDVLELIDALDATQSVKDHMRAVYIILAQAEAQVHDTSIDTVHFHEVGRGTGLLNALTVCMAFDALDARTVCATPVQTGEGQVECAHGFMDIPTPATRAILASGIPTFPERRLGELCTPTSAALIKHFVTEFNDR